MIDVMQPIRLNEEAAIPRVGLGVFRAGHGQETRFAVSEALRLGYRHIDTAAVYGNERDVGAAIRQSGIPREEVFVTSKLWNSDQGYDSALHAYDTSLERFGFEYLDLYLLHWPVPGKRRDSWRALERLLAEGRVRAIGVSNFMKHHLEDLFESAAIAPAVNQIEVSPFLQRREVREHCAEEGIPVVAYSPLTKGIRLGHPVVVEVARQVERTPAQVLLRWGIQKGLVVLPKSIRSERIEENFTLFDFELSDEDMDRLDDLEEGLVTGWDPSTVTD